MDRKERSDFASAAEEFWTRLLRGLTTPTTMRVSRPSAPKSDYSTAQVQSHKLTWRFLQAGPFSGDLLLKAAWALLVHRYSSESDVCFASFSHSEGGNNAASFWPIRPPLISDQPLVDWLTLFSSQQQALQPYRCPSLPELRQLSEMPSALPLFETILLVEPGAAEPPLSSLLLNASGASLAVAVRGTEQVVIDCIYVNEKFDAATVERLLGHFLTLVESILAPKQTRLSELPMLTEFEADQLIYQWNATDVKIPTDISLAELVERQVDKFPETLAVVFQQQQLSYRELNGRANGLAHQLIGCGVGPDVVVAISLERSVEMIVAVLAVLKAGGAYVAVDPAYPSDRRGLMLRDSRAKVLLTQRKLLPGFQGSDVNIICLDNLAPPGSTVSRENPRPSATGANLAYVIYTSGSTGQPKGVAMEQRPLINLVDWQIKTSKLPSGAKTLQFASLSFDVSFQEIFSTLASGGTLVLITEEHRRDFHGLWRLLREERIARLFLPFVALQHLAEMGADDAQLPEHLREIITAGEQLQITPQLRKLFERLPHCSLHNHYGPSETHVVTAYTLQGAPRQWPPLPPIGRPIQNARVYVLDSGRKPVPIGLPGELYIGGLPLARGYLHRPEITAEKFVPSPWEENARLYKTGDSARYLPDGNLEFLGRIDQQVKIRGFRIELGEVESVIALHPAIREIVAAAVKAPDGANRLIAYAVTAEGESGLASRLRDFLRERLPDYMIPTAFVFLERLPLTPSGKVDRRSLPLPEQMPAERSTGYVRPWTTLQCQLAEIWEDLLGVKPIGIKDNFFELGGHSLMAARMMDRIEKIYGKKIPVSVLINASTIEEVGQALVSMKEKEDPSDCVQLQNGSRMPVFFLHGDFDGGGIYCSNLVKQLDPDQPFYAIHPLRVSSFIPTIEDMAEVHLRSLRAKRASGPYILGGFCIGALVAFEMADRLRREGENVYVVLVNPAPANARLRAFRKAANLYTRIQRQQEHERIRTFNAWWNWLMRAKQMAAADFPRKLATLRSKVFSNGKAMPCSNGVPSVPPPTESNEHIATMDAHLWAMAGYTLRPYQGRVLIYLSEEPSLERDDTAKEWGRVCPNLEIHKIRGNHLTSITTHGAALGRILKNVFVEFAGQNEEAAAPKAASAIAV